MKFWKEFKEFAFKGNVVDLAVGVMIGSAFSAIVTALVNNVFTPLISVITGKVDFSTLAVTIGSGENAPVLAYGSFIQAIINFLLVALCIFFFVKGINKLRKPAPAPVEEPKPEPRKCPFCMSVIDEKATRCPHCTSVLEEKA